MSSNEPIITCVACILFLQVIAPLATLLSGGTMDETISYLTDNTYVPYINIGNFGRGYYTISLTIDGTSNIDVLFIKSHAILENNTVNCASENVVQDLSRCGVSWVSYEVTECYKIWDKFSIIVMNADNGVNYIHGHIAISKCAIVSNMREPLNMFFALSPTICSVGLILVIFFFRTVYIASKRMYAAIRSRTRYVRDDNNDDNDNNDIEMSVNAN